MVGVGLRTTFPHGAFRIGNCVADRHVTERTCPHVSREEACRRSSGCDPRTLVYRRSNDGMVHGCVHGVVNASQLIIMGALDASIV